MTPTEARALVPPAHPAAELLPWFSDEELWRAGTMQKTRAACQRLGQACRSASVSDQRPLHFSPAVKKSAADRYQARQQVLLQPLT